MKARTALKARREILNLTRRQVADATGITASYYGMIEQGVRQPALDTAQKLAAFFEATVDDLFPATRCSAENAA